MKVEDREKYIQEQMAESVKLVRGYRTAIRDAAFAGSLPPDEAEQTRSAEREAVRMLLVHVSGIEPVSADIEEVLKS